jgi:hypothetical protein
MFVYIHAVFTTVLRNSLRSLSVCDGRGVDKRKSRFLARLASRRPSETEADGGTPATSWSHEFDSRGECFLLSLVCLICVCLSGVAAPRVRSGECGVAAARTGVTTARGTSERGGGRPLARGERRIRTDTPRRWPPPLHHRLPPRASSILTRPHPASVDALLARSLAGRRLGCISAIRESAAPSTDDVSSRFIAAGRSFSADFASAGTSSRLARRGPGSHLLLRARTSSERRDRSEHSIQPQHASHMRYWQHSEPTWTTRRSRRHLQSQMAVACPSRRTGGGSSVVRDIGNIRRRLIAFCRSHPRRRIHRRPALAVRSTQHHRPLALHPPQPLRPQYVDDTQRHCRPSSHRPSEVTAIASLLESDLNAVYGLALGGGASELVARSLLTPVQVAQKAALVHKQNTKAQRIWQPSRSSFISLPVSTSAPIQAAFLATSTAVEKRITQW